MPLSDHEDHLRNRLKDLAFQVESLRDEADYSFSQGYFESKAGGILNACRELIHSMGMRNAKLDEDRIQFQQSLAESEQGFKQLYSMMSEGVCLHEIVRDDQGRPVDYRILDVNKSYEKIIGIPQKQAVGQLATRLYQTDPPPYFELYLEVSQTGKPAYFEAYWPPIEKYLKVSVFSPSRDRFAAIFTDTTDENVMEEYLSTTLNSIGEGVIETDRDGRIVRMNPVAEAMTGWKNEEAMQRDVEEVFNGIPVGGEIHGSLIQKILRDKKGTGFSDNRLLISRSGRKYVVEQRVVPINRQDGSMVGIFVIFRDKTEKYHSDENLRLSRAMYRELFKAIPMGVAVYEAEDNGENFIIREFNPAAEKIESIQKEQVIGRRVTEVFPGVRRFGLFDVFQRVWRTERPEIFPVSLYQDSRHGSTWRENHVYSLPSGEIVAVYQNVTERVKAMEDLKEREEKFRFLFENMAQGVFYRGAGGVLIDANRSALRIFGDIPDDVQRIRTEGFQLKIIHEDGTEFSPDEYPSNVALKTGKATKNITAGIYHPEINDFVWVSINAIPQFKSGEEKPFQIFVTFHDITDIKKAEMAVREHQVELDAIYQNSQSIMMLTDGEANIYKINQVAAELSGRQVSEMIGMRGGDALNCPYAAEAGCGRGRFCPECTMYKTMKDCLNTGRNHFLVEAEMPVTVNGKEVVLNYLFTTTRLTIKNKPMVLSNIVDITHIKQAEAELRRLGEAVAQASDGIAITQLDGEIIYVNPAFEQMTGYPAKAVIGETPRILENGDPTDVFSRDRFNSLLHGKRWSGRMVNRKKDGVLFTAECSLSPVRNKNGHIVNFVLMMRDITSEVKLEERLSQAQKMEALGTLAGGIAHDFNNILFPLMGYAEMLREDIPEGDPLKSNVEEILSSAFRARDLVQQILTFSRHSKSERKPLRVQTILKEILKLLRSSIPKTISIHHDVDEDCALVMADPTQIHQIIMNLATNAFHAMEEDGGQFNLSLKQLRLGFGNDSVDGLLPGDYLCLKAVDNGIGIPKEIQEKVFDPYFSTKPEGKGTGMGLAMVQGIVRSYGGEIRLFSEPGAGTEICIYLPTIERADNRSEFEEDKPVLGGREKILIIDDEEPVIEMEKMMLERLGYQVTSSTFSWEAFEVFKKDPNQFDLIITDMTMPDFTGFQLSSEIKKIRPDMPVILCTGYSEQVDEEKCKALGIEGYVMKPFGKRQMAETIRRILDHGGSSFSQ